MSENVFSTFGTHPSKGRDLTSIKLSHVELQCRVRGGSSGVFEVSGNPLPLTQLAIVIKSLTVKNNAIHN